MWPRTPLPEPVQFRISNDGKWKASKSEPQKNLHQNQNLKKPSTPSVPYENPVNPTKCSSKGTKCTGHSGVFET
jgi:hypothetical protein